MAGERQSCGGAGQVPGARVWRHGQAEREGGEKEWDGRTEQEEGRAGGGARRGGGLTVCA